MLSTPAMRAAAFFGAPTRQVVEFGTEIEIYARARDGCLL
jgi:hypothetical protein